ncbi:putative phosphatidic acid phosphatase beta [Diplodia seriata]|uniref:Putative lipid phosphate phosphatase 3, chloroplastic n=1 Tax=Diplodia seriata TaxID=420778 RepID=A0A0G2DVK0_9PEZI|nr:putative phosphatidic acid phosphatase beta [Diplodia seriata]OMP86602.1 putative lipid phosphate phosphatase 3, chloroplastic [Diplodia seriata]
MPFFKRQRPSTTSDDAATTSTAPVTHNGHHDHGHHDHPAAGKHAWHTDGSLNKRPPFGQWLKSTWPDILTMFCMGLIGLGVYEAHPAPSRSFPVYFENGEVVYPEFAYPLRNEIVPIWAAALLAVLVPIAVFLIMQIRIRSFWDLNNATIGLLYSVITAAVFQVFLKWLIGGLRPHFLDVCKPNVPLNGLNTGNGLRNIMYDRTICTGDQDEIDDSLESFPSGHTTAAFGGFVYLSLYLNAKLKVAANYHPAMWKLIAIMAPLLGATLIGGALTIDEYHNWYDVLAGAIIGTMMSFVSYRMVYASTWDFRFNHIPLRREVPFTYGAGPASDLFAGFHDTMWTRQVGWGAPEAWSSYGGAPFDASAVGGFAAGGAAAATGVMGGSPTTGHHGHGVGNGHGAGYPTGTAGTRHSVDRRPVPPSKEGRAPEHMV